MDKNSISPSQPIIRRPPAPYHPSQAQPRLTPPQQIKSTNPQIVSPSAAIGNFNTTPIVYHLWVAAFTKGQTTPLPPSPKRCGTFTSPEIARQHALCWVTQQGMKFTAREATYAMDEYYRAATNGQCCMIWTDRSLRDQIGTMYIAWTTEEWLFLQW